MQKEISSTRHYTMAVLVCGLATLFYLYEFTVRTMPSAMTSQLMHDFHMSAAGLGLLSSMFYWGYTFMQIPAGLLFDRYGERVLVLSAGLCSLGTLLFSLTTNKYLADAAFLLIGFAASTAFVGALVLIIKRFPPKYFAMLVGVVQFLGCVGAIAGIGPVVALVKVWGWQSTVGWFAVFGFILTVLMFFFIRTSPKNIRQQNPASQLPALSQTQRLKIVSKNPQTWWVGLYAFAIWGPVIVFAGLFGLPFLETRYHISSELAARGIMIFWLGIAIGGPIMGWISDFLDSRKKPLIFCGVLALLAGGMVIYLDQLSFNMSCVLLFLAGASAAGQALSFGVVQDIHPRNVIGTGAGFNNMAVIIGGLFLQPIAGAILAHCAMGQCIAFPVYHLNDYRLALLCVPLCSLIAILTASFAIRETGCRTIPHPIEGNKVRGEVLY